MIQPIVVRTAPPRSVFGGIGVTPFYGILTRDASLWPQPAKVGTHLQIVPRGNWVRIISQQKGFYAAILENDREGWLPCDAVQFRTSPPSGGFGGGGISPFYGVLTRDASLWRQPAKVGEHIQIVTRGNRVSIIGAQKDFFVAVLQNGHQGWLPCDAVSGDFGGAGMPSLYGILTRDASLWLQPAKVGTHLQIVKQNSWVRIVSTQKDFFAAILDNGRQGWLPCDAVQFR